MYPPAFAYHRAGSLKEAVTMLSQLGEGAKLLAGGQSLIPLMKLRFANPLHLIDLNFIGGASFIREENGGFLFSDPAPNENYTISLHDALLPRLRQWRRR